MEKFQRILLVVHFFIVIFLLGTLLNDYVKPSSFPLLNLLSLAFPVLIIMHVLMIIFWILVQKKTALIFILFTFFLIHPARRWVNFSGKSKDAANLKIVTLNGHSGIMGEKAIQSYLNSVNPDVVFFQESRFYKHEILNLKDLKYRYKCFIVELHSKFEILEAGSILDNPLQGSSFYADIKISGRKIRLVNVYLEPFRFNKKMFKSNVTISTFGQHLNTFENIFLVHQGQVAIIKKFLNESPYPVILAGDFNAVPNSYEYYHLGKGLKDVFMEVGNGSSTSFHDYKFPIRIDYVFCSREIKPISYKVDRSVKISDHFPVIAEFKID